MPELLVAEGFEEMAVLVSAVGLEFGLALDPDPNHAAWFMGSVGLDEFCCTH